jgi:hypothetical protein
MINLLQTNLLQTNLHMSNHPLCNLRTNLLQTNPHHIRPLKHNLRILKPATGNGVPGDSASQHHPIIMAETKVLLNQSSKRANSINYDMVFSTS